MILWPEPDVPSPKSQEKSTMFIELMRLPETLKDITAGAAGLLGVYVIVGLISFLNSSPTNALSSI